MMKGILIILFLVLINCTAQELNSLCKERGHVWESVIPTEDLHYWYLTDGELRENEDVTTLSEVCDYKDVSYKITRTFISNDYNCIRCGKDTTMMLYITEPDTEIVWKK